MSEGEDIFHITDHTHFTEFESLATSIELYLRHTGFSSDFRRHAQPSVSKHFKLGDCSFSCFHSKRTSSQAACYSEEPMCIREMREEGDDSYPFGRPHVLMRLFGISEFLVVQGSKIQASEEATILSAFVVGAQNAKCALPFFISRREKRGIARLLNQGFLTFSGYFVSFEQWEIPKSRVDSTPNPLRQALDFFHTHIEPSASSLKASVFASYQSPKTRSVDVIGKVVVWARWTCRPADDMLIIIRTNGFDTQRSDGLRISVKMDDCAPASSGCILQLNKQEVLDEEFLGEETHSDLQDVDIFDELLFALEGVLPIFPLNSYWVRKAVGLITSGNFTYAAFSALISHLRASSLHEDAPSLSLDDFHSFSRLSELSQHVLIIFSAMQSLHCIQQTASTDPCSRLAFLHNSPAHFPEQQLQDPASTPLYQEQLLLRILKAFLLDMYMKEGYQPTVAQVIQWHKDAISVFPFYAEICSSRDDGQILALWQTATSRSFTETTSFIVNELNKEMEMSLQMLESLSESSARSHLLGLGVSAVLAVTFRNQLALLNESRTGPTAIAEIKQLIHPSFTEFARSCKQHLTSNEQTSPALIEAICPSLLKLEKAIGMAFSLTIKFSESKGLTAKLMQIAEMEVTEEKDRCEVLEMLTNLRPSDLIQTYVVLKTNNTRFTCMEETEKTQMAIARIVKEVKSE